MNAMNFLHAASAVSAIVMILIGSAWIKQFLRQYGR